MGAPKFYDTGLLLTHVLFKWKVKWGRTGNTAIVLYHMQLRTLLFAFLNAIKVVVEGSILALF